MAPMIERVLEIKSTCDYLDTIDKLSDDTLIIIEHFQNDSEETPLSLLYVSNEYLDEDYFLPQMVAASVGMKMWTPEMVERELKTAGVSEEWAYKELEDPQTTRHVMNCFSVASTELGRAVAGFGKTDTPFEMKAGMVIIPVEKESEVIKEKLQYAFQDWL